jgi:hypothetical protein
MTSQKSPPSEGPLTYWHNTTSKRPPQGWRSVDELIADGYRPAPMSRLDELPDRTMKREFNRQVAEFFDDSAGGVMHAGKQAMLASKGSCAEALKHSVLPGDAEELVKNHLAVMINNVFYLSPDAVASLELSGQIAKHPANRAEVGENGRATRRDGSGR